MRDFPIVVSAYGIGEVLQWRDDKEIDNEKEERLNTLALLVWRQYVGQPALAATVYRYNIGSDFSGK